MASERVAAVRDELIAAQAELNETLDRVGDIDWLEVSPYQGWTVRDLLVHLTTSESGFVGTLRRMASGLGGVPADFDPDRWNAGQIRRRASTPPEQLRAELVTAHAEMLSVLDEMDDASLDQQGHLSSGSDGTTEDNFRLVASHKRTHTADMRAVLAAHAGAA